MPTKVCLVKAVVFPAIVFGCESWKIRKAESQRIDALKLWSWRRPLRLQGTARRSNQSILKEINLNVHWKDWCWGWSYNTFITWCKEPTHWKRTKCCERLKAGGEGEDKGWDGWMALPTQWTWVWANSRRWWRTGKSGVLQSMGLQRVTHDWTTEPLFHTRIKVLLLLLSCFNRIPDSVRPHRRQRTRLRRLWDSPGKNTGVGCHFLLQCMKVKTEREVAQSCPTLRDPMDYSLPGSSAHVIFQARVLE